MAEPPKSPPSSDIDGVNRDARAGSPSKESRPDPGAALHQADEGSVGHPDESAPEDSGKSGATPRH